MALRIIALCSLLGAAAAWGPDGHTIVAHIAQAFLTPDVNATLSELLGGISLNNASDWNDDYDHSPEGKWSYGLHFINYAGHACAFDWARDCKDDQCNAGSIVNYTRQLADTSLDSETRLFALKFVIHMMGDIHQPLHVASGDDRGGNKIEIAGNHFSLEPAHWTTSGNLHSQWDSDILLQDIYDMESERSGLSSGFPVHYHKWDLLSDKLQKLMTDGGDWQANVTEWQQPLSSALVESALRDGLALVANGTAKRGCDYAYAWENGTRVTSGQVLDRAYYLRAKPIIEEQLAKGGVRLAQVLNIALAKTHQIVV